MKKVLYGTSAIIAAASFGASASAADPISLGLGGSMQQWFGYTAQEQDGAQNWNDFGINTDTIVEFGGDTTLDNGWVVTATIGMNTNNNNASNPNIDAQFLEVATPFGTVTAGNKGVKNDDLHVSAPEVGIGIKDMSVWMKAPTSGWTSGSGWRNTSIDRVLGGTATVQYESPAIGGLLTLAGSYQPGGIGNADENTATTDAYEMTAKVGGDFGGTAVAVTGGFGSMGTTGAGGNTNFFNVGAEIGVGAVTLGASYLDNSDPAANRTTGATTSQDGSAYDVGIQFDTGAWNFSLSYYAETREGLVATVANEDFNVSMLSARYTLGPGVQWRTSLFAGEKKGEEGADNNSTDTIGLVTGLNLSF